jgi:geranyl-CoA carboxylase beta subunit
MLKFESTFSMSAEISQTQRLAMLALIDHWRGIEQRAQDLSAQAAESFQKRGALLPRERLGAVLDPTSSFLPLANMAGYLMDDTNPETSVAGGSQIAGIGFISGVRCMVVVTDSAIQAGAMTEAGNLKLMRCQEIALENKLPFIHLVESAGANLRKYRIDKFIRGGGIFYNLARLSAAGIPVITSVHGSSTAGGAYMPGMSDYVVMVKDRARAFLAGPPLLKVATGEIATAEELGGAQMHATVSGLAEYVAQDDAHATALVRDIVQNLDWNRSAVLARPVSVLNTVAEAPAWAAGSDIEAPAYDPEELLCIMPINSRTPVDMREVIARLVDGSRWLDFKSGYGPATVCGHARLHGQTVGFVSNNGPLDPAGATKATQFIQLCTQSGTPIIYLQNTTGFIVGRDSEEAGMIKHGSKMIQALSNATVPQITIYCGASYGAGNYGMCGRGFHPRFCFSWPNARTSVMGAEQAAGTLEIVAREQAARRGTPVDEQALELQKTEIIENFERQASALVTSGLLLDDGVIDPRDTRAVLAQVLATCREASQRVTQPMQFGVARF